MAKKKKHEEHAGGHGWFVTFADLMGLLLAFFVMLVASSTQDKQKLKIMAGSMRDAFGTQNVNRFAGIVEIDGIPTRPRLKNADKTIRPEDSSAGESCARRRRVESRWRWRAWAAQCWPRPRRARRTDAPDWALPR